MTPEERVGQLEKQQSLQSAAIAQLLANNYQQGSASAKGLLVQLDPTKYRDLGVIEKLDAHAPVVPPPATSIVVYRQPGTIAGTFTAQPEGIILHGSRSGQAWTVKAEFDSCRNFAASGANGLGWNATIGEDAYSVHMTARQYGWNARYHSRVFLAVEFAQATAQRAITDAQIRAFAAWYWDIAAKVWGKLPLQNDAALPCHSELAAGRADGKSDAHPYGSPECDELRRRIRAALL